MKNFRDMPANSMAIAPDIPISNAVPKSGCLMINNTGTITIAIAINIYLVLGGSGLIVAAAALNVEHDWLVGHWPFAIAVLSLVLLVRR